MTMVYFLVLVSTGGYNSGNVTIHEVPFQSAEVCVETAKFLMEQAPSLTATCFSQAAEEVSQRNGKYHYH